MIADSRSANLGAALFNRAYDLIDCAPAQRDFKRARELFSQAAAAGNLDAVRMVGNFAARGIAQRRDWTAALASYRHVATVDAQTERTIKLIDSMVLTSDGNPVTAAQLEQISAKPRIARIAQFLTADECDMLISLSAPMSRPAQVVDPYSGRLIHDPVRKAHSAFFGILSESPFVHAINRRIALASSTDVDQGEPLQILRYRVGDEYRPHVDNVAGDDNDRLITFLICLDDRFSGGETEFPLAGVKVRLEKGAAMMFYNCQGNQPDPLAVHAGLPVTKGEKIIASRWIRKRRFSPWPDQ
ncbi:hypothetical protein FSZ31_08915 [Sphingorhabdus soli]|uniref:Fe2OG dioxygenase domain-containing protein n=1 Tax=Flavisphingopyxis soli TaxID=2601267 RepID=A0A5C6UBB3_9SPHN|nr:2OG-Fe(II) oxygenase [Sphingorhabdus soli]TXC69048.1 hypothetical protein FSZ31_08915 [Sphingorhabdus soli]